MTIFSIYPKLTQVNRRQGERKRERKATKLKFINKTEYQKMMSSTGSKEKL